MVVSRYIAILIGEHLSFGNVVSSLRSRHVSTPYLMRSLPNHFIHYFGPNAMWQHITTSPWNYVWVPPHGEVAMNRRTHHVMTYLTLHAMWNLVNGPTSCHFTTYSSSSHHLSFPCYLASWRNSPFSGGEVASCRVFKVFRRPRYLANRILWNFPASEVVSHQIIHWFHPWGPFILDAHLASNSPDNCQRRWVVIAFWERQTH